MNEESLLDPIIAEFQPKNCSSLESEFKTITTALKNADPDYWDKREQALRKIACICVHPDTDLGELAKQIRFLKTTLQTQVEDLRSAIVRTTAALCVVLHEHLGTTFHSIFEFLLPSFVKQLAVKAVPTRESAHECLMRVICGGETQCYNERLLRLVFSYSADKDKVIRTRIALYVHGLCGAWSSELIQKHLKDIVDYLMRAQGDGESKVRAAAREAVALLGADYPKTIARAVQGVTDAKQKKELMKVIPDSVKELLGGGLEVTPAPRRTVSAQPRGRNIQSGVRPSRASTGNTPAMRRGSAPTVAMSAGSLSVPGASSRASTGDRPRGPQISPALERRLSRNGILERRMSKTGIRGRTKSAAPPIVENPSPLPSGGRRRSISERPRAPMKRPSINHFGPNRDKSPSSMIARPRASRGSMDSTASGASSYAGRRLSGGSVGGGSVDSRRGSNESYGFRGTPTLSPTPTPPPEPVTEAEPEPVMEESIAEEPAHTSPRLPMSSGSDLSLESQAPINETGMNEMKEFSLSAASHSPRQVLTERRAPSPFRRNLEKASQQGREEKQLMAAKLADSVDLLDLDLEGENSSPVNRGPASDRVADKGVVESPADLLARLRSLREQVQRLPGQ